MFNDSQRSVTLCVHKSFVILNKCILVDKTFYFIGCSLCAYIFVVILVFSGQFCEKRVLQESKYMMAMYHTRDSRHEKHMF